VDAGQFEHGMEEAMKWNCIMAGSLAIAASATSAQEAISACPVPAGAVKVALPSGLPHALRDKMGNVALPGEPFNTIDIYVKGQPNRRYLFVWNIDSRWIVATEQGGIALRSAVFVYDLGKDGKTVTLIDKRIGFPSDACAAASRMAGG
jgi:hypothetical protein